MNRNTLWSLVFAVFFILATCFGVPAEEEHQGAGEEDHGDEALPDEDPEAVELEADGVPPVAPEGFVNAGAVRFVSERDDRVELEVDVRLAD